MECRLLYSSAAAEHRLESFVLGRSEWCISRQRTWGVPIPALHCKATGDSILDADSLDHIIGVLERKGVDHWWSGPVDEFISPTLAPKYPAGTLIKGTDTMDVWFDSGTSWTLLSSLKLRGKENVAADVCLEGTDQHRGWFQSLLLTMAGAKDLEDTPSAPYKDVLTHGFVLDEKGKKMSKSLGNVISPTTIVLGGKVYIITRVLPQNTNHQVRIRSSIRHMVQMCYDSGPPLSSMEKMYP